MAKCRSARFLLFETVYFNVQYGSEDSEGEGEMMGMKPTGKSFKMKDVDIYTFNDAGKVTEHRQAQSAQEVMMRVGAMMGN